MKNKQFERDFVRITYDAACLMTQEWRGVNALSANPAGLFLNKHYSKRLQNYDIRLGTNGGDEWSWNRGALRLYSPTGAQASRLPRARATPLA